MLVSMGLLFLVVFSLVFSDLLVRKTDAAREELFLDFGQAIQTELIMAASVNSGYQRTFRVPDGSLSAQLDDFVYTLTSFSDRIEISYSSKTIYLPIPPIVGSLQVGENTVRNVDGVLYVNT
ncbi:MAG: hypothetical protein ABIH41_01020 [Nanoarchaeota archaeon]